MSALTLLILGLFTAVPPASCQQGLGNLQPWMQGLIAVAVFLVLVAIAFAVNRFWCQEEPWGQRSHSRGLNSNKKPGAFCWKCFLFQWTQALPSVDADPVHPVPEEAPEEVWGEPVNMVMTIANKADGILGGTDGRYSLTAASFRSSEHENAYENVPEEEGNVRSTPM
eukprot:XP_005629080.1 PDZK1-interacting protein 1 isoform X1 [Canis lupus familiaris]